jgi:hypothetical protein
MQILLLVIIVLLSGYIVFLHLMLVRKNLFIESTVRSLTGLEKEWKRDELFKFLEEIRKNSHYSSFFNDKLFEDRNIGFILEHVSDSKIYIHYTREEPDAKNIAENGFRFVDSFYKTALPVSNDRLDLIIKHNSRKYFGDWVIVICISDKIIEQYKSELVSAKVKNYFVENVLTENPPLRNENSDMIYILPRQDRKSVV